MPFIVGHPVQNPSDFYGRDRQISRLYKIIGGPQAQSVTILGLNRAGKTSFLNHVAHPTTRVRYLRHPENMVMIYVDMASCKTPAHFYYRIQTQLKMQLGKVHTGFLWKDSHADEMSIYDVEAFLCHFPSRRIILLLDGFDDLNPDTFGRNFLTELRAMTSVSDYDLSIVVASSVDLFLLGSRVGLPMSSPFYNIFFPVPIYIGELETAVVDSLICQPAIQAGIPFSANDLLQIKQLAGNLPFVIQATAARWLYLRQQSLVPDPQVVTNHLVAELAPFFNEWWSVLDQCQRQILSQLAQEQSLSNLSYSQFTRIEAEKRLQEYGLVTNNKEYATAINGHIFAAWIKQHIGMDTTEKRLPAQRHETTISASIY